MIRVKSASVVALLDHDNSPHGAKSLKEILVTWLEDIPTAALRATVQDADVRAYGGWWQEDSSSSARGEAVAFYTEECPALITAGERYWRIKFAFADYLLHDLNVRHAPRVEHTFVLRPAPSLFSPLTGATACAEQGCEIRKIRKWMLKRRGCTRTACPNAFGQLWYKPEQKQVDTHLVLDLLYLCTRGSEATDVLVVSDDADFGPALLVAASAGTGARITVARFSSKKNYLDQYLVEAGIKILVL